MTLSPPAFGEESLALPFFAGAGALTVALVFAIALGVRSPGHAVGMGQRRTGWRDSGY